MQDEREHLAKTFDLLLSISLPLMMKYFSRIILRIFVTLNVLQFKILKRNPLTFTTRIKMKFYEPSQRKIQSDRKFALVIFHFFQLLISFALIFDCIKHKARTSRTQKVKWLLISVVKCFFSPLIRLASHISSIFWHDEWCFTSNIYKWIHWKNRNENSTKRMIRNEEVASEDCK